MSERAPELTVGRADRAGCAFLGWSPATLVVTERFHSKGTEALLAASGIPVVETWDYAPRRKTIQAGYSNREVGIQAARY